MKLIKKFANILLLILIFGLVPLVLFVFITSRSSVIAGIRSYVVVTGSMKPKLPIGSMVFTIPQKSYSIGDIITFHRGNISVTHRIHALKGTEFITKGDANNAPDPQVVTVNQIVGKDIAIIPYIGHFTAFLKSPLGFGLLMGVPTLFFVLFEGFEIKKEWEKIIEKRVKDKMLNMDIMRPLEL